MHSKIFVGDGTTKDFLLDDIQIFNLLVVKIKNYTYSIITDYVLNGNTISLTSPLAVDEKMRVFSTRTIINNTTYNTVGGFYPSSIGKSFDEITAIAKDINDSILAILRDDCLKNSVVNYEENKSLVWKNNQLATSDKDPDRGVDKIDEIVTIANDVENISIEAAQKITDNNQKLADANRAKNDSEWYNSQAYSRLQETKTYAEEASNPTNYKIVDIAMFQTDYETNFYNTGKNLVATPLITTEVGLHSYFLNVEFTATYFNKTGSDIVPTVHDGLYFLVYSFFNGNINPQPLFFYKLIVTGEEFVIPANGFIQITRNFSCLYTKAPIITQIRFGVEHSYFYRSDIDIDVDDIKAFFRKFN